MLTSSEWVGFVGGVVGAASPIIYLVFGKHFYERWLEHRFAERIEHQKHELQKAFLTYQQSLLDDSERIKANHQRLLQDFSHYTVKRHEVYPRLYRLVRMAHDYTDELNPNRLVQPDYANVELPAIQERLRFLKTAEETQKTIEKMWFDNRSLALSLTEDAIAQGQRQLARRARQRAVNYYLVNELYLASEVSTAVSTLLRRLARYQFVCNANVDPAHVDSRQEEASESMSMTYHAMVKELRAGDYKESLDRDAKNRLLEEKRSEISKHI
jgi:hypothetical protein